MQPQLTPHPPFCPPPKLDIAYDGFVRTTDAGHEALVEEVLRRVWDKVGGGGRKGLGAGTAAPHGLTAALGAAPPVKTPRQRPSPSFLRKPTPTLHNNQTPRHANHPNPLPTKPNQTNPNLIHSNINHPSSKRATSTAPPTAGGTAWTARSTRTRRSWERATPARRTSSPASTGRRCVWVGMSQRAVFSHQPDPIQTNPTKNHQKKPFKTPKPPQTAKPPNRQPPQNHPNPRRTTSLLCPSTRTAWQS